MYVHYTKLLIRKEPLKNSMLIKITCFQKYNIILKMKISIVIRKSVVDFFRTD